MKLVRHFVFIISGFLLVAGTGGWCEGGTLSRTYEDLKSCLQRIVPPPSPSGDPVLARVGQGEIRQSEFLNYLSSFPPAARPQAATPEGRRQMLQGLIYQKSIAELARQAGIEHDPEFQKSVNSYVEGQLSRLYMERLGAKTPVTDAEIQDYYKTHSQDFMEGTIQASHIVTRSQKDAEKAQKMLQGGKSFAQVARAVSIDRASAQNGGRMPPTRFGRGNPVVDQVLRSLQKGKVSGVIPTPSGFELIRKDEETKGSQKSLIAVKEEIRSMLQSQKAFKQLNDAKEKLPVTIDQKQLDALPPTPR
jgi:peptidyl-prolyl cis-trans isomerase C